MKSKSQFIPSYNITKTYNSRTPSLRHRRILKQPPKLLRIKSNSISIKNHAGRNRTGRITTRHHGGRHKRYLRKIDWLRNYGSHSISKFVSLEYDPNRSTNIARYITPQFKNYYIVAPDLPELTIQGPNHPGERFIVNGDTLPFKDIPVGSKCYNIQTSRFKKPTLAKSSGSAATLLKKDSLNAILRLPSKKIIYLDSSCIATIGIPSNSNEKLTVLGKAGASRWKGKRPNVRGYAMNPIDHPHGGKTKGGFQPKTKWGKQAKWVRTRNHKVQIHF